MTDLIKNKNVLVLAYIGDSVFEIYIREYLINKNICKVKELQKEATKYVSAKGQASFIKMILEKNILDDDEKEVVYRARNHHMTHKPKSCDIITYQYATALEALIGSLYLEKKYDRIKEIMDMIVGVL